ncbi:MAG: hypothetical protein KTR33_03845 [Gammaproteobacteria bacterium]|nr:hypothetical protein [Gammaproteobacteria bacterium]
MADTTEHEHNGDIDMLLSHRPLLESAGGNVISLANHPLAAERQTANQIPDHVPGTTSGLHSQLPDPLAAAPSAADSAIGNSLSCGSSGSLSVIDFFDRMTFQASIELDDLLWIRGHFTVRVRHQIMSAVRKLLCAEFGRRMVERNQLLFTVRHRDVNTLIAGLLRVQFNANQILLPEYNVFGDRVEQNGVTVTWGVGRSLDEAQHERIKKRKRRNLRRR